MRLRLKKQKSDFFEGFAMSDAKFPFTRDVSFKALLLFAIIRIMLTWGLIKVAITFVLQNQTDARIAYLEPVLQAALADFVFADAGT